METYSHEIGHTLGLKNKNSLETSFQSVRKNNHIAPVTSYAATGGRETFAEAFGYFHTDPESIRSNVPLLYEWFEFVEVHGTPPPPKAKTAAPPAAKKTGSREKT